MKKKIFIICIIFVFWFALHISATIADGLNDEMEISDAAVVLGNKVDPSGLPSPRLKSRLDKAIELYEKGFVKYIIVSGGKGEEGYDEALVMRKYLVSKNISYDFIIEDNNGMNSYLTAVNSKEIMRKRGFGSVIIVSQYYHLPRCKLVF